MANSQLIVDLYSAVFRKQKDDFNASKGDIVKGMAQIGEAYLPDRNWEYKRNSPSDYYEGAAHRCAYLHKYAMVHTGLLCDLLDQALKVYAIKEVMDKGTDSLKICSLGSGPGTDIVACLLVLKEYFGTIPIKTTLIDCCGGWEFVFEAIVSKLENKYNEDFEYEYVVADLLDFGCHHLSVSPAIKSADVVTMVKFVSAAACRDTRAMVKSIFRVMKPGALLLFVDNAAGGFHEMMSQTAKECGLKSVFEPLRHYHYKEETFRREYCNWKSQYEARVTVEIWEKTEILPWNTTQELQRQFINQARNLGARFTDEDFPVLQSGGSLRPNPIIIDEVDHSSFPPPSLVRKSEGGFETETNKKCCIIM